MIGKLLSLLLLISLTSSFQLQREKPTPPATSPATAPERNQKRLDADDSVSREAVLAAGELGVDGEESGFTEVDEKDIPEGALVYVLEEAEGRSGDGEVLETASNIVFRPLFRYRSKQEAQRRNRVRRRYFMPRRSYRETYHYPYYYRGYY